MEKEIRVWDAPLRIFHWSLVVAVTVAMFSGVNGNMKLHLNSGLVIIALLAFRLAWLLLGSTYARVGALCYASLRIPQYLRGEWNRLGHNPLGVLSMVAMLAFLGWQAVSGLFTYDENYRTGGPLYNLLGDRGFSLWLTGLHRKGFWLIIGLIGLHVASVLFYWLVKKNNLIKPMITGKTQARSPEYKPATGGRWLALVFSLLFAAGAYYIAQGSWVPKPPPPPASVFDPFSM